MPSAKYKMAYKILSTLLPLDIVNNILKYKENDYEERYINILHLCKIITSCNAKYVAQYRHTLLYGYHNDEYHKKIKNTIISRKKHNCAQSYVHDANYRIDRNDSIRISIRILQNYKIWPKYFAYDIIENNIREYVLNCRWCRGNTFPSFCSGCDFSLCTDDLIMC